MLGLGHGRGQVQYVTIGGSRDGKVTAYHLEVVQDSGAYPQVGALLPDLTKMMLTGTYDIPTGRVFFPLGSNQYHSAHCLPGRGPP